MRTLWLVIAFLLAVGVPFLAFATQTTVCTTPLPAPACATAPSLGWPGAVLVSLIALVLAGFAVRQSAKAGSKDPRP